MRILIRLTMIATLLMGPTVPAMVASSAAEDASGPVYACESDPAEDTGDVQIGTALTLYRGPDAERASADCDGTLTQR